jgi:uncharacterized protein
MNPLPYNAFLFEQEGKDNLVQAITLAIQCCKERNIKRLVIFTSSGEGLKIALDAAVDLNEIQIIGVLLPKSFKPPAGQNIGIESSLMKILQDKKIQIVQADKFPFDVLAPFDPTSKKRPPLSRSLRIFGGGMHFAVQAVLMACDANLIGPGEHAVAATADTVIVTTASKSIDFETKFIVREIICKPMFMTISRKEAIPSSLADKPQN